MSYLPVVRHPSYVPFLHPWAQEVSTWWAKLCCMKAQKCKAGFLLVCETLNNLVYSGIRALAACTQQDKQQHLWSLEDDIMGEVLTTQAEANKRARHSGMDL